MLTIENKNDLLFGSDNKQILNLKGECFTPLITMPVNVLYENSNAMLDQSETTMSERYMDLLSKKSKPKTISSP